MNSHMVGGVSQKKKIEQGSKKSASQPVDQKRKREKESEKHQKHPNGSVMACMHPEPRPSTDHPKNKKIDPENPSPPFVRTRHALSSFPGKIVHVQKRRKKSKRKLAQIRHANDMMHMLL